MTVYCEGPFGIVSTGRLLNGRVGSERHNFIRCTRTGNFYKDRANWQTRKQYESLRGRDALLRGRNGSLHSSVRPELAK